MQTPAIVSPQEWQEAWERMLLKEKEFTRARDVLAAERRRMPWMAVDKDYRFEGPKGEARLLDLFQGCRQLIVYRTFDATCFRPGCAEVSMVPGPRVMTAVTPSKARPRWAVPSSVGRDGGSPTPRPGSVEG